MRLATVVLAAGEGTRLRSRRTKILHLLAGKPIARYVLDTALSVGAEETVFVVGRDSEQLRQELGTDRIGYVYQEERRGTGHAALQAKRVLAGRSDMVLVCYGDMPLLRAETLQLLVDNQGRGACALTMLTLVHDDSMGFGRVLRGPDGRVLEVVEEKVCTPEQLAIKELNCGVYCFDAAWLWAHIDDIPLNPVKDEYLLTDIVGIAVSDGKRVDAIAIDDADEMIGINTRAHLAQAEAAIRRRVNTRLMASGVTLQDPGTTYVEPAVEVGQDTVLLANTHLRGKTRVGRECTIGPNTVVQDSTIGDRCRVIASLLEGTVVPSGREVGPFAHLTAGGAPQEGEAP